MLGKLSRVWLSNHSHVTEAVIHVALILAELQNQIPFSRLSYR